MKQFFKEFIYFTRGERRGILTLVLLIVLVILLGQIYSSLQKKNSFTTEQLKQQADSMAVYRQFIAHIEQKELEQEKRFTTYDVQKKQELSPISFNPNQVDSTTLRKIGLPDWMVRNIMRYRAQGGKFKKAEDFRKIYGLTEEQYQALQPYIYIAKEDTARPEVPQYLKATSSDTLPLVYPPKYSPGTMVNLNQADTTELQKIPGIGSTIAKMIVNYRQRLGGYYRIEQLQEINLDAEQLRSWFTIQTDSIEHLPINRLSVDRLRRHPYINFYQARAIVEYRKKQGQLKSLKPLSLLEEFTEEDLQRIEQYIRFD